MTEPEEDQSLSETIGGLVGLVTRRRWWIVIAAVSVTLAVVSITMRLPNRYTSEVILSVVQPQISQRYVESTAAPTTGSIIQGLTRDILSRNRLIRIADELGLYANVRQRLSTDGLAQLMQKDVQVELLDNAGQNDFRAFKVIFTAATPQLAQAAASRIAFLFIEENLITRGDQAAKTVKFLSTELETAKAKLSEQEKRLQDFKMRNLSELPEQQQANVAILNDRRMQLQNVLAGLSRLQQQRTSLESSVGGRVATLESERSSLLIRFTPRHSEVIKKSKEIEEFQAVLERIRRGTPRGADLGSSASHSDPALAQWESQANSIALEADSLAREKQRLEAEIASYQNRVTVAPLAEQQLAVLLRDYELYKKEYTDLLGRQGQSQETARLEETQEGQHFRLVDQATLPLLPSSPKRLQMSLGGLGAGLAVGLALAFVIDLRTRTFHNEKEISRNFTLPLLVAVPELLTPAEERARSWKKVFESLAVSVMFLVVCAAELYVFRHQ